jgi:iduronate 2-sulfatase
MNETMKNPQPACFLGAVVFALAACPLPAAEALPDTRPRNVLFIICDDLNTHVSTSGYSPIHTPAFDSLAAAAVTFSRAYCQYPVCGPSRASLLSGLYPESTGVTANDADIRETRPGTLTMPAQFRQAGYWTARTGKVFHNPATNPDDAWDENPDLFRNDEMPVEKAAREAFEAKHGPVTHPKNRKAWREHLPTVATQTRNQAAGYGPSGLRDEQHMDGKNARQIAKWLDGRAFGDKPFFMVCGIHKPHVPFLAPDKYFEMYPREKLVFKPARPDFWQQAPQIAQDHRYRAFGFELGVENDPLRREYMQAYHACISFIDAQIALILDALRRNGHWDDTLIVLTSDHGYQLGEHFMWGKVTLFEECARVPLILRVPGSANTGGRTTAELVELVDLFPTLAELCAVKPPPHLQGRSMVPLLNDPAAKGREAAYTVVIRRGQLGRSIRTADWRYARWPGNAEELYHLKNDPAEETNLAATAENRKQLRLMRVMLDRAQTEAAAKRN